MGCILEGTRIQHALYLYAKQNSFRKRKQCVDNVFMVRQLTEELRELDKVAHITFVDIGNDFDRVNNNMVFADKKNITQSNARC